MYIVTAKTKAKAPDYPGNDVAWEVGYLLSLQRGSWTKAYNRQCLDLWGKKYGEQVASKVERLVKDKWHESPSSSKTA